MSGYGAREVARMVGLSVGQVRSYVKQGFIIPERGPRGALSFTFEDMVLLRAAKGLLASKIPARRVRTALGKLRINLPAGRPLRALRIFAEDDEVLVGDGRSKFRAGDGQLLLDFDTQDLAEQAAPLVLAAVRAEREIRLAKARQPTAENWYERGCDLEGLDEQAAREAYRRTLELEPDHVQAHLNLGRLLHEHGDPRAAAAHYRLALDAQPDDATAWFNLGVALEDTGDIEAAIAAYVHAVEVEPSLADAHFNASRLYERRGQKAPALKHLRAYGKLTE
jgi:tetratricopeptide (TPR) repeat protein